MVPAMTARYYASFFVHTDSGRVSFEYDGIVEMAGDEPAADRDGNEDLARLVARNLEVSAADVHVLEWQRLH
jgi:hypothetical protein